MAPRKRATPAKDQPSAGDTQMDTAGQGAPLAAPQETTAPALPGPATDEDDIMQNSIRNGATIEYTPAAEVKGGDLVVFPAMVAVAITDIPADGLGSLAAEGVFELPKDGTALAQGQAAYATSAGVITATASGNTLAGKVWGEAAGAASVVQVKINA